MNQFGKTKNPRDRRQREETIKQHKVKRRIQKINKKRQNRKEASNFHS